MNPTPPKPATWRLVVCLLLAVTGTFIALASMLALKFEMDGFRSDSEAGTNPYYVASLIATVAASLIIPAVAFVTLLKGSRRLTVIAVVAVAALCTFSLLGLG